MKTKAGRAERWFKRETEGLDETLERSARDAIPGGEPGAASRICLGVGDLGPRDRAAA